MNTQHRIGRTAASKLGISIFDCTGKTIKQLQDLVRAENLRKAEDRSDTLESRAPAENRTMALEDGEIIEISASQRSVPADEKATDPQPAPASDEGDLADLLADIGRLSGRPPAPDVKLTAQRSEDSVLFQLPGSEARRSGQSSIMASLEELQRIGQARASEKPAADKPKRPESSVEVSLKELQQIESDRVDAEAAERAESERVAAEEISAELAEARKREDERRAQAEADAREEAELQAADERLAREVDELLESFPPDETERSGSCELSEVQMLLYSDILPEGKERWIIPVTLSGHPHVDAELTSKIGDSPTITLGQSTYYVCDEGHGAEKAVSAVRRGREVSFSRKEISVEIPIEVESPDTPWSQDYIAHTLEGDELKDASIVLPERAVRWLVPVPDAGDSETAAKAVLKRFRDEPRLTLWGKSFFVYAGKEGFAGAKWCARTGSLLQMWSEPGTDYSMESSLGGSEGGVRAMEMAVPEGKKGVPWGEAHVRYLLQGEEYVSSFATLPERAVRWLIPAPEPDMKDRVSESIRKKFKDEPRLNLGGKDYYVYDGEDGFANARWCARTGNVLNIWPQAMTEYDYVGSLGGASSAGAVRTVSETDWPERFIYHSMSREEAERNADMFPGKEPVLMHPVPPADTLVNSEQAMRDELPAMGARPVVLGDREYFVMPLDSTAAWRKFTILCPKARVASRLDDKITIWEEAGASLFSGTTFNVHPPDKRGAPLPPHGGLVAPFENETLDLEFLYQDGKKSRYLYQIPERVSELGTETFTNLVQIASAEARKTGQTPLISVRGRWFFALEYAYVGSRLTTLEDGQLRVYPENSLGTSQGDAIARMKERLSRKRRESEPDFVTLPSDPRQRKDLMTSFPPGKVRYLYNIDATDPNYAPRDSDIMIRDGDAESVWRMSDRPIPGMTIPVVREGERIAPVRESQFPQSASEMLAQIPADFGKKPERTMELSVGDLMVEPPARSSPPPVPPRRPTIKGPPMREPADAERSVPAIQITTSEIEIIPDEEKKAGAARGTIQGMPPIRSKGADASEPAMEIQSGEIELVEDSGVAGKKKGDERSEPATEIHTGEFEIEEDK